jgi:hypothetical protein
MSHVVVIIVVIVPPVIAVILGKNRAEGKTCTHHRERNRLAYAFHANHSFNRNTYWTSLFAAKSQQIAPPLRSPRRTPVKNVISAVKDVIQDQPLSRTAITGRKKGARRLPCSIGSDDCELDLFDPVHKGLQPA